VLSQRARAPPLRGRSPQLLNQRVQPISTIHPTTLTNRTTKDNSAHPHPDPHQIERPIRPSGASHVAAQWAQPGDQAWLSASSSADWKDVGSSTSRTARWNS
jgi:hypothetical protein